MALSKFAIIFSLILVGAPRWAPGQTVNYPFGFPSQAPTSNAPENQQTGTSGPLAPTQVPLQLPQLRSDPTTITNVYPGQENAERQRELQLQQWQQQQAMLKLMAMPTPTPEPDTEFQEFVAGSVGTRLPIFGQNMFDSVPSTFAPLDRVQVTPDYMLGPGDELVIRTWGQINVDWRAVIDRTGAIYIPKVGVFNVAGVRYEDLHDYLNAQIGRIFKGYQLSVTLGSLRSIQVFIVGQVKRPGVYTISSLSSLVDALFASGGLSKRGSLRRIQLKRNGQTVTTFDLYDLIVSGDKSKDAKLLPGDVIYVPAVGPLVALAGSVNTPAIFELKDHSTLGEVIRYAGGLTNTAAADRVVVERIDNRSPRPAPQVARDQREGVVRTNTPAGESVVVEPVGGGRVRSAEEIALNQEGMARELHDGDVVRFLRVLSKFDNSVTLRGNVAVPGRYPWHPNMRVHDLIPDRDFLVTEDYWRKQNELAAAARTPDVRIGQAELKNDVKRVSAEINWEYAVIQRLNPQDLSSHLVPFNLARAIEGDETQNLALQPGDVITIFSQADLQVPIRQQSKFIYIEGEFVRAGVYQVYSGETLRQLIRRIGGLTPQAYIYGSEFTRQSTRETQQQRLDEYVNSLDKAISRNSAAIAAGGDPAEAAIAKAQEQSQRTLVERMKGLKATGRIVLELRPNMNGTEAFPDLVLEDGDRLVVPFRPATVNVIGSVYNSNAFIYKTGKTVGDYLRLAGGPTRDGDGHREFVIRADGSTVSRQQHSGLLSPGFNSLRLMPGDTLVVPEKINRGATLRALRDYSVIFGQLGLAAGGIRALFP
jgi:protein involved in polysaccharide export with SLBB domain